jgi:hypothetical protein
VTYHDLGAQYFDDRDKTGLIKRTVKRLDALACIVEVQLPAAA